MSYSFSVTGKTKDEAKAKIAEQMDGVVRSQAPHAADRDAAVNAANAFVDLLTVADGHEVHVSMHGSLGWNHDATDKFTGAGIGISASARSAA